MIEITTHTNHAFRHDELDPALKLLVGFNLLNVIAGAIVETLTNLVGYGRLWKRIAIQTRSRQGHFLLHGLPEAKQPLTTALHASSELLAQLAILLSHKVDLISKATDDLFTQREKTLLQLCFYLGHLRLKGGIIVFFDVLAQHARQFTRVERLKRVKLNSPFAMPRLEAEPSPFRFLNRRTRQAVVLHLVEGEHHRKHPHIQFQPRAPHKVFQLARDSHWHGLTGRVKVRHVEDAGRLIHFTQTISQGQRRGDGEFPRARLQVGSIALTKRNEHVIHG